jgi:hypothetical protein
MISEVEIKENRFRIDYFDNKANFIRRHFVKFDLDEGSGSVVLDAIYDTNITGENDAFKILWNSQEMKIAIEEREQQLGIGKHKTKQP